MKKHLHLLALLLSFAAQAQFMTHGPVTGGITENGARIYLRTATPRPFSLEIATDAAFANVVWSQADSTRANKDNSRIVNVTGLQADSKYYLRFLFNGTADTRRGSFMTAPMPGQAGHYVFVTGSCQETPNMKVFDVMPRHHPRMLLHTGDYTYPSYQIGYNTYPGNWNAVELAWRKRYEEVMMDTMLFNMPIDYTPDDEDNWGDSRDYRVDLHTTDVGGVVYNSFTADTVGAIDKEHVLRGYREFFPGYALPDSLKAQYHRFTYGNCDFFATDVRSTTQHPVLGMRYDSAANFWSYVPDTLSILGVDQRNWLLSELSASTADWKFILCGIPFNPSYRRLIDVGMTLQGFVFAVAGQSGSGMRLALAFAHYWGGHPYDVNALLGHIRQNNIQNCIFITGDTHHNVMDDGTNSKLPELNASGLSVTTTELAYQIDQYAQILGQPSVRDSLWNKGGNGLGNMNFLNAFGKIEVFGQDSVKLCVIDENDLELSCQTVLPGYTVLGVHQPDPPATRTGMLTAFPNPTFGTLHIQANAALAQETWLSANVLDLQGRIVQTLPAENLKNTRSLDVSTLPAGAYLLMVDTKGYRTGCVFMVLEP